MTKTKKQVGKLTDSKQGTILTFFQNVNNNKLTTKKSLFSVVGGNGTGSSGIVRSRTSTTDSNDSIDDDCMIVPGTPESDCKNTTAYVAVDGCQSNAARAKREQSLTGLRPHLFGNDTSVNGNISGAQSGMQLTIVNHRSTEPVLIPDTPDRIPRQHRKFNRSFLHSGVCLKPAPQSPVRSKTTAGNTRTAKTSRRKLHSVLPLADNTVNEVASICQLQQMGIVCATVTCGKNKQAPTVGLSPQRKRRELSCQQGAVDHVRTCEDNEGDDDDDDDEDCDNDFCTEVVAAPTEQYRPFQWSRGATANKALVETDAVNTQADSILSGILDELKSETDYSKAETNTDSVTVVVTIDHSNTVQTVGEKHAQNNGDLQADAELSDIMKDLVAQCKTEVPEGTVLSGVEITKPSAGSTPLADIIHELRSTPMNAFRTPSKGKFHKRKKFNPGVSTDKLQLAIDEKAEVECCVKNQPSKESAMEDFDAKNEDGKCNEVEAISEHLLSSWSPCKVRPLEADLCPNQKSCHKSLLPVQSAEEIRDEWQDDFSDLSPVNYAENNVSVTNQHGGNRKAPCDKFGRQIVTALHKTRDYVQLDVTAVNDKAQRKVFLHGFWMDTEVEVGDVVNVLGTFDATDDACSVTDDEHMFVVNPDFLISGTTVVSSLFCMRKSILSDKFRGIDRNIHMLLGSIIHALFQQVLKVQAFSESRILQLATQVLSQKKFLHEMFNHSINEEAVLEEIKAYIPTMISCIEKYFTIGVNAVQNQRNGSADEKITSIVDIEENIWSPRFGLKGKIDVTVEAVVRSEPKRRMMPLELKTGKASYSVEHKGQVTLYSMMMSDRHEDPRAGLLMYLKAGTMQMVSADHAHQRGLIQIRNSLSHYMQPRIKKDEQSGDISIGALPPPVDKKHFCTKCPQLLNCALLQRSEGFHAPDQHAMSTLVPQALRHLTDAHLQYFSHWCLLMHLEAAADHDKSHLRDIWCKSGIAREESGNCWSNMVLLAGECRPFGEENFLQTFIRHKSHNRAVPITEVGIMVGDSIIVSEERRDLIALSTGFVQQVTGDRVLLTLDRNLCSYPNHAEMLFRLDKGNYFNSMSTGLTSLSRLMADDPVSARLRELIIDKRRPEFDLTLSKQSIEKVKHVFKTLNKPQKTAILKVLMCKDYVLIKGYPGTGKTSTIVALVRILVSLGQSVVLASYTNAAVDNILLKLKEFNIDMTRLGRRAKIHADVMAYSAEKQTSRLKTVDDLANFYNSKAVVASTCLGSGDGVFRQRVFDVCIVDEASQVSQLACVTPLFSCRRFVLVGDPLQLPPLVCSMQARNLGMDKSLFAELDDAGGTYELNLQYRMNSCIMRLSNELVYNGALKCGSESVATATLQIRPLSADLPTWLSFALSDKAGHEVVFLNMDAVAADKEHSSVQNRAEAAIVFVMIKTALSSGIAAEDLGVIAPYQQQVRLLRDGVKQQNAHKVEVNTVDQYQGRDKSVIFISFVKNTASHGAASGILADKRRLNVALSRARHKLVLVGSVLHLSTFSAIGDLMKILKAEQMVSLPTDVLSECTELLSF